MAWVRIRRKTCEEALWWMIRLILAVAWISLAVALPIGLTAPEGAGGAFVAMVVVIVSAAVLLWAIGPAILLLWSKRQPRTAACTSDRGQLPGPSRDEPECERNGEY